jgi:sigma-E factor negative regulatory protein RseA
MTERISSLIDGELKSGAELDQALRSLGEGTPERAQWDAYHLIGDALRDTHGVGLGKEAFAKRLGDEPTVLAPRRLEPHLLERPVSSPVRWPMRMAAGIAAVAFVGWVAVSFFDAPFATNQLAGSAVRPTLVSATPGGTGSPTSTAFPASPSGTVAPVPSSLDDYMWAHQRYSPSSLTHGVAPYVRLVSGRGAGQ